MVVAVNEVSLCKEAIICDDTRYFVEKKPVIWLKITFSNKPDRQKYRHKELFFVPFDF